MEEQITDGIIKIQEKIAAGDVAAATQFVPPADNLQLPKIELPKFDGNYLNWRNFFDLFSELVDRRPLAPCQKLLYLKSSLTGEAEGLIHNFATTAENYDIAWQTLKNRNENKRVLVNALLKRLLSQPSSTHENVSSLKQLHDTTQECLHSLNNLGIVTDSWDPIILHILVQRLSKQTHVLWEQSLIDPQELPSLLEFLNFIQTRFQSLEAFGDRSTQSVPHHQKQIRSFGVAVSSKENCIICQGTHQLYSCQAFLKMTPKERLHAIQRAKCCVNCMKVGHNAKHCNSSKCTKCGQKHNTLLHLGTDHKLNQLSRVKTSSTVSNQANSHLATTAVGIEFKKSSAAILSTACINIKDASGQIHKCRALLDSGSQANFISKGLANKLGLQKLNGMIAIEGIGQTRSRTIGRINIEISSLTTGFNQRIEVHVLPKIVSVQPTKQLDIVNWKIPANIKLSDVDFATPSRVDLLIGAGVFYSILSVGQISLGPGLPVLQNTLLGWVVGGEYNSNLMQNIHCGVGISSNLDESLEKFWQIEEFETQSKSYTAAEMRCEEHFLKHIRKHADGRYIIKLPFQINASHLGESQDIALQRFKAIERKLQKNAQLSTEYKNFMQKYEELNHMKEIPIESIPKNHYFLLDHAVFKLHSSTTKTRVVFDASAKTSSNYSLNDVLYTGPTTQSDVFTSILRFRFPRYAFTADVEKMYRQNWVNEEDRKFQLIWWRENPTLPMRCMQLNTVTYGTTCTPYLATRTLQYIADSNKDNYPLAAAALKNNFYVDDVLTGSDKITIALEMQQQLREVLSQSGLNLRKWCANDERLLSNIPIADREVSLNMPGAPEENIKTMGITWFPKKDVFTIKITQEDRTKVTKRTALADISKLFDPLGLVAPIVVIAKIFLQQLWKLKLDWDSALLYDLHTKWLQFRHELGCLQQINIPRHIFNHSVPRTIQLHIFADASEAAYGAVAYVRAIDLNNTVIVRLLCSKSKVAPVKQITLPRLELCAAKLATDLAQRLKKDRILPHCEIFFWSDSTAVIGWIRATSSNYHTFVANRISAIQQVSTPQQWHYVPTHHNPADLISRGLMPEQLLDNVQWFYGPLFLHAPISAWPLQPPHQNCELELRQRVVATSLPSQITSSLFQTIKHGNSLRKLQRIMAYVYRFIAASRVKTERKSKKSTKQLPPPPSTIEMEQSLLMLVRISQEEDFAEDIKSLRQNNGVNMKSSISSLAPFIDKQGILRVGGRLEESNLSYDAKHQMLLSYHHPMTKMIFHTLHKENKHVGAQTLLSHVRQRFWPLKGKNVARSTIQSCIFCTRTKPKLFQQLMGALPKDRVQPARPFINTGVDFFGPVWVHVKIRGKQPLKSYVAVFCCFATKAVHLELVSDLSTEAFLGSLRRFMARRGHCNKIYCDNATNFVGAKNKLKELNEILFPANAQHKIQNECSKRNVQFSFIPPRAPHFGGLWESAVKSAKQLLHSSLAVANLTREEMETVLTETEAIMNSRPLTPMSNDPNDLTALTPGHFLIGEPLTAPADVHASDRQLQPLTRWKLVTHIKNEFWRRWSNEYLQTLQNRYKWKTEQTNVTPGTMVIIKDDNLPSFQWSIGRIKNVIRGNDGLVRVADVQTAKHIIRRPIAKLAPLPIEKDFTKTASENTGRIDEIQTPRPKRPKLMNSLTTTLLLIVLILPLCWGAAIKVQRFSTNPGMYYENLGTASMTISEWNLISYIDMQSYWKKYDLIQRYPNAIKKAAKEVESLHGGAIVSLIEGLLKEIEQQNYVLKPSATSRKKRGAFNIVGNVANALFGILDAAYAEEVEQTISQIKENENYLVDHLKNQTSFIDTTIHIMKKNQDQTDSELKQITKVLNRLQNQQLKCETVAELAIQATLDILQVHRIQNSLLEALVSTHHGNISPLLLSPQQLQSELKKIKENLPSHVTLPAITDDLINFYKLMKIEGRSMTNYVIFKITIPLVSHQQFELLKITAVPWLSNGTFFKLVPSYTFMIINLHRDQYLPLTDLSSCIMIRQNYFCNQNHPLHKNGSLIAACELQLLQSNQLNPSCKINQSNPGPHWYQMHNPNVWLYSVQENYIVNTVCDSTPGQLLLNYSGILTLQADCSIKQPQLTIQGYRKFATSINRSYIPAIDINQLVFNPMNISSKPISSSLSLDILHNKLTHMHIELPNSINGHDIHHYAVNYTCVAALLLITYYIYHKFKQRTADTPTTIIPMDTKASTHNAQYDEETKPIEDHIIRITV